MRKKGQAAMEFLMTYGWAILVVLGAIAALAYFGVLSPQQFIPEKCTMPPGIACLDQTANTSHVQVVLKNGLGQTLNLNNITMSEDGTPEECDYPSAIDNGGNAIINCSITSTVGSGDKVMADIEIAYDTDSGLTHTKTGDVVVNIP
ncbi:MAG: hypothetical protein R6V53_03770 [Candidatus Woesearchaeota archaeon]